MPELPEVEAVARRLREQVAGRTIVAARFFHKRTTRPQSAASLVRRLRAREITSIARRAKNILLNLTGGDLLRIHLGMTGELYVTDTPDGSGATRARFSLDDGREIIFDDWRLFGRINLVKPSELDAFESSYGIEPMSADFTAEWLIERATRSRKPAKLFLMDQTHIAGLGNIWAAEALYEARINPKQPMNAVSRQKIRALHTAIRKVLEFAIQRAYRDYVRPGETSGSEGYGFAVYGRAGEPCLRCGKKIVKMKQGGRSTYYCPRCQRELRSGASLR